MFGLGSIFNILFSSNDINEDDIYGEDIDEDEFYKASEIDIQSSVCTVHEGNILAQTGDVLHSSDIKELQEEVFNHTYGLK